MVILRPHADKVDSLLKSYISLESSLMALAYSLTHSILINLFIKVGLTIFSPPCPLSIVFVPSTSVHVFVKFYRGSGKEYIFVQQHWRIMAQRSKVVFHLLCKQEFLPGLKNGILLL